MASGNSLAYGPTGLDFLVDDGIANGPKAVAKELHSVTKD